MSAQPAPLTPAQLIELGEAIYNASNETAGPLYLHPQRAAILADMARAAIGALEGMGLVIVPRTDRNAHSAPPVQAEPLHSGPAPGAAPFRSTGPRLRRPTDP